MSADNKQAKGKRGGLRSTSWKPGCPSPNPGGRPATSYRASELVRELVDPAEWIGFELGIARDKDQPVERRVAAWHALIDRGFVKPPAGLDVNVSKGTDEHDYSQLTDEQVRELLAAHERALAGAEQGRGTPSVTDEDADAVHRLTTTTDEL